MHTRVNLGPFFRFTSVVDGEKTVEAKSLRFFRFYTILFVRQENELSSEKGPSNSLTLALPCSVMDN